MRKRSLAITSLLLALAAGFAPAFGQDLKALEEGAKKEGKLNLYASMREDEAKPVLDTFEKKYPGVKVDYFRSSDEKLASRVLAEAKAKTYNFDAMITSGSWDIKNLGMVLKWTPPAASGVNPDLLDPDGMANPVYINTNVIQYNSRLVAKADVPKNYEDLAHPKWKGKLCLEDSDFEWFVGLQKSMGKAKALELFKRIAANQPAIRALSTLDQTATGHLCQSYHELASALGSLLWPTQSWSPATTNAPPAHGRSLAGLGLPRRHGG